MKIADRSVDGFLKRPDAKIRAVLFYGSDLGLIRERATQIAKTVLPDLSDPFRLVELPAKSVRDDPARLADEAAAIAFTGGRKVVWIKDAGDGATDAAESLFAQSGWDALVIVEGPELSTRSKLVELFAEDDTAAAIGCYPDREAAIERVVEETLALHGLEIAPDALAFMSEHLGGDRGVTRAEAEKLALFCAGQKTVTRADAMAAIGDSAAVGMDDAIAGAFEGDSVKLSRALGRLRGEGISPVAILTAAQRHAQRLHLVASAVADGAPALSAIRSLRPPVFFEAAASFERQARRWSPALVGRAISLLTEADLRCRSTGSPAQALLGQVLQAIGGLARRP
ncbi:MAG: DNA polymerase III subunit delta [Alphaproteobacteria bacterium]|nr:DNA polymerase III subunit delta [Alphaproteobacteria bacterium]